MRSLPNLFFLFIAVTIWCGGLSACAEVDNCSMEGRNMMYCTVMTIDPDDGTTALNDTLDSLTVTALETDYVILNNDKEVHTIALPLRYTNDTTVFVFHYDPDRKSTDTDTLYVIHENDITFVSMDCGYNVEQSIEDVWKGKPGRQGTPEPTGSGQPDQIDSIYISYTEANANGTQNLEIFYNYRESRMASDEEEE